MSDAVPRYICKELCVRGWQTESVPEFKHEINTTVKLLNYYKWHVLWAYNTRTCVHWSAISGLWIRVPMVGWLVLVGDVDLDDVVGKSNLPANFMMG